MQDYKNTIMQEHIILIIQYCKNAVLQECEKYNCAKMREKNKNGENCDKWWNIQKSKLMQKRQLSIAFAIIKIEL